MAVLRYYALVASLPRLEHFERAERLPISRLRLEQRLAMLEPEDAAQLSRADHLVGWEHHRMSRTDEQIAEQYRRVMKSTTNRALSDFVEYRMDERTIVVAMRRRHLGMGPPPRGTVWGVGRWGLVLADRWEQPDFGLVSLHPWIPDALELLQEGDAFGLEKLLMNAVWTRLDRIAGADPFGFERVFSFFFKWDILRRWLSYDADKARARFRELISDAIGEHEVLFQ